jgi:hypothetical protein
VSLVFVSLWRALEASIESSESFIMDGLVRISILAASVLAIAATPDGAWAGKGGSGHGSGARSGSHHHHHHHASFSGGFVVGSPFWYPYYPYYYGSPTYYYGPNYGRPQYDPPTVYVEKFEGTPTPETQGEIFCQDRGAYYPDVQDCPGGWQRVFQASTPPD